MKTRLCWGEVLKRYGFDLVSGGTDNHLLLVDLRSKNLTGHDAELMLDDVGITVNKNMVPFDHPEFTGNQWDQDQHFQQ